MNFYDDFDIGFDSLDSPIVTVDAPPAEVTPVRAPDPVVAVAPKVKKPGIRKLKFFLFEAHAKILAGLTHFKPVETLRTIEDVYRNLVVFEGNFEQTCNDFRKLGADRLEVQQVGGKGGASLCRIKVGQFVLAEAQGSTNRVAKRHALDTFYKTAKRHCYRLEYLKASNALENQIARRPNGGIGIYKNIIKQFRQESIEQELVFRPEFTKEERSVLIKHASKMDLKAIAFGPKDNLQLKVLGLPIPALAIVERILVRKDPQLRALYQAILPMVGARRID
ncbi:hypothetical protein quinque_012470 [Culex quinquefasciatus]